MMRWVRNALLSATLLPAFLALPACEQDGTFEEAGEEMDEAGEEAQEEAEQLEEDVEGRADEAEEELQD